MAIDLGFLVIGDIQYRVLAPIVFAIYNSSFYIDLDCMLKTEKLITINMEVS